MTKRYMIITYGCQMNNHDSERIAYHLESLGYRPTCEKEKADFLLYNTCLVRENAELKVYGQLGAAKHLKRKDPNMILAVSGCMMQTGPAREMIKNKYPHVDLIFGTKNIDALPQLIDRHLQTGQRVVDISDTEVIDKENHAVRQYPFMSYINIMYGCNNFCTYCIVPYARGHERSRDPQVIINEIKKCAKRGSLEVMLLGQNVNSYGKTLDKSVTFARLLKEVAKIDGIERIRFMTSHPKDLSDELIDVIASEPKICPSLHLPLQSGSDRILELMNRKYTSAHYLGLVEKLRNRIPQIALTTDIIVGFPGETEADFQKTIDMCEKVRYDQAFTFLYSPRPGTKATEMKGQVEKEIMKDRFQRLLDVLYPHFYEINQSYLGQTVNVLVESISKNNDEVLMGRSEAYKLVHFKGNKDLIGKIVPVTIENHTSFTLEGRIS